MMRCLLLYGNGSSPRVRGTHEYHGARRTGVRFIPAGAGNTFSELLHQKNLPVHPRGCGEHSVYIIKIDNFSGSSPRVRGTL